MEKFIKAALFAIVLVNLFLASWYVLNNDLYFNTDVARDFLLFGEIDQKKLIFIGPRTSAGGLFHGPLWLYLNYPAYLLGNGNPIVVGWFWIFLITCFLIISFIIAKKLFNDKAAFLYILILSIYLVFETKALLNPHGAFFLLPIFFFFFIRYITTLNVYYLAAHLFIAGLIIQFQMAIGIPLLGLSSLYILFVVVKKKKLNHLLAYLLLFVSLSNFIVFDLRHDFIQAKALLRNLTPASGNPNLTYGAMLLGRWSMLTNLQLIKNVSDWRNIFFFLFLMFLMMIQIRDNRYKVIYKSFLYFYFGYYLLYSVSKQVILTHQFLPWFSLIFLVFSSLITSRYDKIFLVVFSVIFISNFLYASDSTKSARDFFGKDEDSWKFLFNLSKKVYQFQDKEFGYFIYAPDVVAYEPKYAMLYAGKFYEKRVYSFQKKPVTYLVIAPPPPDNPYMKDEWWRINQIKIDRQPSWVIEYPNGYKIEKYLLSEEETQIPYNTSINPGLHFR